MKEPSGFKVNVPLDGAELTDAVSGSPSISLSLFSTPGTAIVRSVSSFVE